MITIQDDGPGIENVQSLLTLGASVWSIATQEKEDPAGMGFFSLCRSGVEVHSRYRLVKIAPMIHSALVGGQRLRLLDQPQLRGMWTAGSTGGRRELLRQIQFIDRLFDLAI